MSNPLVESSGESTLPFTSLGKSPDYDENDNPCTQKTAEVNKDISCDVCFICREKDLPDVDCKACQNIRLYYSNKNKNELQEKADSKSFPGPGVIKRNHIYGNYVVASRIIEAGETIILEKPISIGPYGPPDILPLCLSCSKDVGLSSKEKCSKCKWPMCGVECEKHYLHADNECKIFAENGVKYKTALKEYFSVETLRALLLRDRDNRHWNTILNFEAHSEARSNDGPAKETTDFIIDFIRNKCNLADQFSPEIISHVVGVLSVNTFWAYRDLKRYASLLFENITLFAHDCEPNTRRKLIFLPHESQEDNNGNEVGVINIALHIIASRQIAEGEMITIRYINIDQPLNKRRQELKETFYFDCTCSRCLFEMREEQSLCEISELSTYMRK